MKRRVIIENRGGLSDLECLEYAAMVMAKGRISGSGNKAQYCYHTKFSTGVHVSAFWNRCSDWLVVWHYPTPTTPSKGALK